MALQRKGLCIKLKSKFNFLGFYQRLIPWISLQSFLFKKFFRFTRHSPWRTTFGFCPHIRATPPFAKIFDFVQNGSSWRVKSALLDFAGASLCGTPFQIPYSRNFSLR